MLVKYLGFDAMEELKEEKLKAEVAELRTDNDEEAITFEFSREPKTETKS